MGAELIVQAKQLFRDVFDDVDEHGSCLHQSLCLQFVAAKAGRRLLMQAGSCFWPRLDDESDDGVSPNVFGYQFDVEAARPLIAVGMLPEMHVWLVDPLAEELIDMTAGEFPVQCRRMLGFGWQTKAPPEVLWCQFSELPERVQYHAERHACEVAAMYAYDLLASHGDDMRNRLRRRL
jgi:hypothetical protein